MIRLYMNKRELDVNEDVDFPITFSQSDAKDPSKTKRSASKTIVLPGTRRNKSFFMSSYNLALSDIYGDGIGFEFDPTVRYPVFATRHGKPVFVGAGNLRMVYKEKGEVSFHLVMYSNIVDIVQALGDRLVSELGWSEYDHILNVTNIQNTWTAGTGSGVVYPYIFFGFDQDPQVIKTNQLYPYVYEVEVLQKCLAVGGFTLDSAFFDTATQQKVIWGWGGGDPIGISSVDAAARHVEYTGDGVSGNPWSISVQGVPFVFQQETQFATTDSILIDDNEVLELTLVDDPSTQFQESIGIMTIANPGDYRVQISGDFPITYGFSTALSGEEYYISFTAKIFKNFAEVGAQEIIITDTASGSDTLSLDLSVDINADASDIVTIQFFVDTFGTQAQQISLATLDIDIDFNNTLLYEIDALDTTIVDGDTVNVARFLPNQKAADFLKDVILQYNLYVSDPDENREISMLPLDDYFYETDDTDVWSKKIDRDSPIEIEPASKIEGKTYSFRWAEDRDYYKKLFFDKYGIDYGDYNYDVPSTFKKGVKEYQLKSAMSVPVQIEDTDLIVPFIVQRNETTGVYSPHKGKARKFYFNGLVSTTDDWSLVNSDTGAVTTITQNPQAHHLDSLTSPANDLCFNNPVIVYYETTSYTNNGLFAAYHAKFIREITSRDSKILNAWFRLNEDDFYENFLRRLVNIDGVQYRKNIVKDWLANTDNLVKVELIKIIEGNSSSIRTVQVSKGEPSQNGYGGDPDTPITTDTATKSFQNAYNFDTSASNITVTLDGDNPAILPGYTCEIKKTTSAKKITVQATGGATGGTIDGVAEVYITTKNDNVTFYYFGNGVWKIV